MHILRLCPFRTYILICPHSQSCIFHQEQLPLAFHTTICGMLAHIFSFTNLSASLGNHFGALTSDSSLSNPDIGILELESGPRPPTLAVRLSIFDLGFEVWIPNFGPLCGIFMLAIATKMESLL